MSSSRAENSLSGHAGIHKIGGKNEKGQLVDDRRPGPRRPRHIHGVGRLWRPEWQDGAGLEHDGLGLGYLERRPLDVRVRRRNVFPNFVLHCLPLRPRALGGAEPEEIKAPHPRQPTRGGELFSSTGFFIFGQPGRLSNNFCTVAIHLNRSN